MPIQIFNLHFHSQTKINYLIREKAQTCCPQSRALVTHFTYKTGSKGSNHSNQELEITSHISEVLFQQALSCESMRTHS